MLCVACMHRIRRRIRLRSCSIPGAIDRFCTQRSSMHATISNAAGFLESRQRHDMRSFSNFADREWTP